VVIFKDKVNFYLSLDTSPVGIFVFILLLLLWLSTLSEKQKNHRISFDGFDLLLS